MDDSLMFDEGVFSRDQRLLERYTKYIIDDLFEKDEIQIVRNHVIKNPEFNGIKLNSLDINKLIQERKDKLRFSFMAGFLMDRFDIGEETTYKLLDKDDIISLGFHKAKLDDHYKRVLTDFNSADERKVCYIYYRHDGDNVFPISLWIGNENKDEVFSETHSVSIGYISITNKYELTELLKQLGIDDNGNR